MIGLLAAIGAAAAFATAPALAEPAYSVGDRAAQYQESDASVSGIERQLVSVGQNDPSMLRGRSTVGAHVGVGQLAVPVSGIERQFAPANTDLSILRDRSTDRGSVSNVEEPAGAGAISDDGFGWAQIGVGAVSLLGLMFLLTTFTLRRSRQHPKSA